ncbi:MAG: pyridoxamine 5'-phosphate oxidase family protein [Polyangiaceae bacterium]
MTDSSPFHPGEQRVQERIGVRERSERGGRRMIREFMPDEHREFFEELPFLVLGSLDAQGRPWASMVSGEPGFVLAPTPRALLVAASVVAGDPLADNLRPGAPLGVLGIQLETRRRNRANGRVSWVSERGFELSVEQSFGNCKQYIQARTPEARPASRVDRPPQVGGARLGARAVELLARCDTAFLATASAEAALGGREGVDVSHRGGLPGFIRVEDTGVASRLTLPDFYGNFMFNSFGNIEVNPRAGFLACDFESGDLLSLTGRARVIWDGPQVEAFAGAERLLEIDVEEHRLLAAAMPFAWSRPVFSAQLADTGTW